MFASRGVLSEAYGHSGPGVGLGDGQTEAEGVPSQGGRGGVLLRRMPSYLTREMYIHICGYLKKVFLNFTHVNTNTKIRGLYIVSS